MKRRKWIRCGVLLIAAALYLWAAFICQSAKEDANLTYIVLSQSIDATVAEEIFEQETLLEDSIGFCFWGEAATQMVSCKETSGIAEVTQVLLSGNPGLMGAGVLTWQDGCLIDESTAEKLFGTADCGGQTLWKGDMPYRVFGTISTFQPTMLTIAAEKDGAVLNRSVLSVPAEQGAQIASQFLMRWGLQGEMIDFYPLWVAVHNLLMLLPGIPLFAALVYRIRRFRTLPSPDRIKSGILLMGEVADIILAIAITTQPFVLFLLHFHFKKHFFKGSHKWKCPKTRFRFCGICHDQCAFPINSRFVHCMLNCDGFAFKIDGIPSQTKNFDATQAVE